MDEKLIIRDLIINDYKALTPLIEALGYPATHEEVKQRIEKIVLDKTLTTFVAELNGKIVGFIGLCKSFAYERNECYVRVTALVVSEEYRKKGIGTKLIQASEEWSRKEKASSIVLNSGINRKEAHKFYENKGYKIKGYSFFKDIS